MELLIGVAGPGAAPGECADVLVRAQEGATVADLARALAGAAPDPVVVALGSGEGAPGAPPAPALWVGDALLDPGPGWRRARCATARSWASRGPRPTSTSPAG